MSSTAETLPLIEDVRIACPDPRQLGKVCISSLMWAHDLASRRGYGFTMRGYAHNSPVPDPETTRSLTEEEWDYFILDSRTLDVSAAAQDPTLVTIHPHSVPGSATVRRLRGYTTADWRLDRETLDPDDERRSFYGLTRSAPGQVTTTPQPRIKGVRRLGMHIDEEREYARRIGIVLRGARGVLLGTIGLPQLNEYTGAEITTNRELRYQLAVRHPELMKAIRVLHVPLDEGDIYGNNTCNTLHDGYSRFNNQRLWTRMGIGPRSVIGFIRIAALGGR